MSSREAEHTELPIPNGWFAVAFSRDLVPGDVKRIHYFGEDLVLFRTRSGAARVLDAYCAHLGAHLGEGGRVIGESIRCPFHGWRYDGSGACVEIPYCDKIPPRARLRGWDVLERNHLIFVWRHAEGKPPDWEVPALPEFERPDWSPPRTFELAVPVHMQDMHENNNDPVHFHFVHGNLQMPRAEIEFREQGRVMHMVSRQRRETPYGTFDTALETDSWGLGLAAVRIVGIGDAGLLMFSSTSPVDRRNTHSRWVFTVSRDFADAAGEDFVQGLSNGVLQDLRIWTHKVHRAEPVLCEADGYLAQFRRWARQFYSEPA
ncbi:MAG TPA: Rieske 2Fe-2S domain-containing protein [Myxococcota bacterium]|nr:Rieske 2Fe-2S domain-containing protein [Myxococcota bacterium]